MRATREQQYITRRYYTGNTRRLSDFPSLSEFVNSAILSVLHPIVLRFVEENLLQRETSLTKSLLHDKNVLRS